MKKLFALIALLSLTAAAEDIKLGWVNGDNPTATAQWQTIVYIGTSPGVGPTNYTSTVTVSWPATTATATNLPGGVRYYFTVAHTDLEDISDKSNEVNKKTKINPPKQLSVIP